MQVSETLTMNQAAEKELLSGLAERHSALFSGFSDVLSETRNKSIKSFVSSGLPGKNNELWKYSPVAKFIDKQVVPAVNDAKDNVTDREIEKAIVPGMASNLIVLNRGRMVKHLSHIVDQGLQVNSLEKVMNDNPEAINHFDSRLVNGDKDPFIYLNKAFTGTGIFIQIPDRTVLKNPIQIIAMDNQSEHAISNYSIIIDAGKSSSANLVFTMTSNGGKKPNGLSNVLAQVNCRENSQIDWCTTQHRLYDQNVILNFEAYVDATATFNQVTLTNSGRSVRNNTSVFLNGQAAEANIFGLYSTSSDMHVDNRTLIDHRVPHCHSNELFKGILDDESHGIFNGRIMVHKDAQKTLAFQHNANLLLSDAATVHTKPQLEIFADDVKCSHGATAGQLDEEALYYLRTRGLGAEDARKLLLYAFSGEIIEKISMPELKSHLTSEMKGNLLV